MGEDKDNKITHIARNRTSLSLRAKKNTNNYMAYESSAPPLCLPPPPPKGSGTRSCGFGASPGALGAPKCLILAQVNAISIPFSGRGPSAPVPNISTFVCTALCVQRQSLPRYGSLRSTRGPAPTLPLKNKTPAVATDHLVCAPPSTTCRQCLQLAESVYMGQTVSTDYNPQIL